MALKLHCKKQMLVLKMELMLGCIQTFVIELACISCWFQLVSEGKSLQMWNHLHENEESHVNLIRGNETKQQNLTSSASSSFQTVHVPFSQLVRAILQIDIFSSARTKKSYQISA